MLSNHFTPGVISIDKLPNTFKSHAVHSLFNSLTFSALIAVICNYNATLLSKPFHVITKINIQILVTLTAAPMPGALTLPPTAPNPSEPEAPVDNEGDMSTLMAHASQCKPSKTP
jgi:hypothetical protein